MEKTYFFPKISYLKRIWSFLITVFLSCFSYGQTTVTINTPGASTWTVPANVNSITVECWGGGGAGGGDSQNNAKGAGGAAGGSYASSVIAVTPGQVFNYSVGAGGIGTNDTGVSGSPTWFDNTLTLFAQGGEGGVRSQSGATGGTGSTALSFGTTLVSGGNGATGTATVGGSGGSGANGGGAGGAQRTTDGNGNNGVAPGGGGGGAFTGGNTDRNGGSGGNGRLRITYTVTIPGNVPCDAITVSNNGCTTQSNLGATHSGIPNSGCMVGYNNLDIWLVTTADANGALEVETNHLPGSPMDDTVLAFYTGTCGSLTQIACDDDSGDGSLEAYELITGLAPNQTVYVRIWGYSGFADGPGPFEICFTSPPPPPGNDLCSGAINLPCDTIDLAGTTDGATNGSVGPLCTMSSYGVWYTFQGDGNLANISVDPESGYDIELNISSGSCGSLTNIACVDSSGSGGVEFYSFVTTAGVNYYVFIADWLSGASASDTGNFTISRTCQTVTPPANDEVCNAIDLVVNGSCVTTGGTTLYATNSLGVPAPTCGSYSGGDVWYTVTVPPTASLTVSTTTGTANDINLAIYSGTCSGTLTQLSGTSCSTGTSLSLTSANGIAPGQTIFVRVWEAGNNQNGSFSICATSTVPPGTNGVQICLGTNSQPMTTDLVCNTATTIPAPPLSGTITSSSPSANRLDTLITSNEPCLFESGVSRFYDVINFSVTSTGSYIFTSSGAFDTMGYIVVNDGNFVPGSCGSGTYIAGDDDSAGYPLSQITATLTQGVNYSLITTHWGSSYGSYSWSVGLTPTSAEWYTTASGGSPAGYGAFFDPIGNPAVTSAGAPYSSLTDTNTPGTYSFWVACPGSTTRTQVNYVILEDPIVTFTGTPGCNSFDVTITISQPGITQWSQVSYTTNGGSTFTNLGTITSPFTFTVYDTTVPDGTLLELYRIRWASASGCFATYSELSVSIPINYSCACKTWTAGAGNTNWFNDNNWSPTGYPQSTDCVIIPSASLDPEIGGGFDADALDITILNGGYLTVFPGGTLTVQNEVDINAGGTLELQSQNGAADGTSSSLSGSLIQVNNVTNTVNGTFNISRAAYVRTRDYVYWSSPVQNFAVGGIATTVHKYKWIPTVPTNAPPTEYGEWQQTSENMVAGKGYIVRGPAGNGNTDTTASWNTILFNGPPNNGTIQTPIVRGTYTAGNVGNPNPGQATITKDDDNWNLVGNPYPSTLDAELFLTTNTNANKITGTMWLWTHVTRIAQGVGNPFYGSYVYNYDTDDYMSYNGTASNPIGWSGNIGSGQGFFVLMSDALSTSENLEFNNSMRITGTEQFLRSSSTSEKHRIWVDLVNLQTNQISTVAIGYVEGATNEFDNLYDAPLFSGSTAKIFMPMESEERKLSIQGRQLPFDINDQIPISVIVDQLGTYGLGVQHYDGLFDYDNQEVYVKDLELGITHNIKESPYYFNASTTGVINDRFVIVYRDNSLSSEDFNLDALNISAPGSNFIKVSSKNELINSVIVFDMLGRVLIDNKDINAQEFIINEIPQSGGTYIVKVTLLNGQEKIQKVVLK